MTGQHGGPRPGSGRKPKTEQRDDVAKFNEARARKESALADLRTMEAQTRAGELLELADVQQTVSVAFKQIAQAIFSLPDVLEQRCGLTPSQASEAEKICDSAMADLHKSLAGMTNPKEKTQ